MKGVTVPPYRQPNKHKPHMRRNQTALPQVRKDVRCKVCALFPGDGYAISAGHNIHVDVLPENILALFDTAFAESDCSAAA